MIRRKTGREAEALADVCSHASSSTMTRRGGSGTYSANGPVVCSETDSVVLGQIVSNKTNAGGFRLKLIVFHRSKI